MARVSKTTPEMTDAYRAMYIRVLGEMIERLTAGAQISACSFHEDPEEETIHYHVDITFRREAFETDRLTRKHMQRLGAELILAARAPKEPGA